MGGAHSCRPGTGWTVLTTWRGNEGILTSWSPGTFGARRQRARNGRSTRRHCLVAGTPIVERVPGFVSVQRVHGAVALYQALNRRELLETARGAGLMPLREFPSGQHPPIVNAPEQPLECGWLFRRGEAA